MAKIIIPDLTSTNNSVGFNRSGSQGLFLQLETEELSRIKGGLESTYIYVDKKTNKVLAIQIVIDGKSDVYVERF